jgi:predicted permease
VAGLGLAYGGLRALVALAPPDLPRLASVTIDGTVLLFMFAATAAAGILFGMVPAIKAARVDVNDSLKAGGRGAVDDGGRRGLRGLLVVSEFAMAMVLLVAAVLILRSFFGLLSVDSGFNPQNVVAMEVSVAGTTHGRPSQRADFFRELIARLRGLPGVEAASAINHLPLVGDQWRFPFVVQGRAAKRSEELPSATFRAVLPGYFQTMGIPMLKGRDIADRDIAAAPHVVVINDFMARRHWPGEDPIGQRLAAGGGSKPDWCTVVGVIKNAKQSAWSAADSEEMYFPYLQTALYLENPKSFAAYLSVVVRTASSPSSMIASAEGVVRSIEPAAVVTGATTMEKAIESQLVAPRFYLLLLGLFAALAVTLAAIGIYGVISHSVARRTHEIGLRMALGADGGAIVRGVIGGGLRLAAIGSAIGCVGALLSTTYLRSLLFGVEPIDPATFAVVAAALLLVATVACWLPGRRAAHVDPMVALRAD